MSFRRFENSRNVKVLLSEIPSLLAHPCPFAVCSTITNYDRVGFPHFHFHLSYFWFRLRQTAHC